MISPTARPSPFVDDEGHVLSHTEPLLALLTLVAEAYDHARIALPVSVTRKPSASRASGAEIVWTKLSASHLMEVASSELGHLRRLADGGFIWPDFLPAYDATATLAKLLDLLAIVGRPLSSIVKSLPRVHMAHEAVPTPWERKGR